MDENIQELEKKVQDLKDNFDEHQHSGNLTNRINASDLTEEDEKYLTNAEIKTRKVWIDGLPIYRQVVNFGALPNNTIKSVALGVDVPLAQFGALTGLFPIDHDSATSTVWSCGNRGDATTNENWGVNNSTTTTYVFCTTDFDATSKDAYVTVEYTRTNV